MARTLREKADAYDDAVMDLEEAKRILVRQLAIEHIHGVEYRTLSNKTGIPRTTIHGWVKRWIEDHG